MKKIALITLLACTATFGLFAFMAFLISHDEVRLTPPEDLPFVEVMRLPDETPAQIKPQPPIQPPEPPKPMPNTVMTPDIIDTTPILMYTHGTAEIPNDEINTLTLNAKADGDARPLVRVNPKYPMKAARDGIEGWVVLAFNINKAGDVIDISIIDSQPKKVFDQAARRALQKWKYQAKTVAGQAVEQYNFSVQLDFTMG